MERAADFVVVTQGLCFLCRDKIEIEVQFESESILESIVKRNQSTNQSIQYISRYLKMDMRKVFVSDGAIPPHLLEKVQRSRLKVELCDDCSRLNDTFSKLFRKLEKAKIEIASCLRKITKRISYADEVRKDLQFHSMTKCEPKDVSSMEKLKIAEALRRDAVHKCNRKLQLGGGGPRVKVKKLSPDDIPSKQDDVRPNTPDDNSGHWDVSDTMEMDADVNDANAYSYQSVETMPRQSNSFDQSSLSSINPETGKLKCKICHKEFARRSSGFRNHYQTVHLKIRFKCSICHADFSQKAHLAMHQRSVHFGQRFTFTCKFCSKTLPVGSRSYHRKSCNKMKQRQRQRNARELPITTEVTSSKTNSGVKHETSDDDDDDHTGLTTPKSEAVE